MWVSAVTFRADYTANQSGSPRADWVFSQHQPVPTAAAIAVHDCPEWELTITDPGLCLSSEVQEVECSWFLLRGLKAENWQQHRGRKGLSQLGIPIAVGTSQQSLRQLVTSITFSLEQRTTGTYVLKLTFCTHRSREWSCPPGVRIFSYI